MESNIKKIEKDIDFLNQKLDAFESELDNLELKVSIIKEMKKNKGAKATHEIEEELKKIIDRLQSLMISTGINNIK